MPELRKVGIVSCSGEELAEGTVARLAALKVLNELRPRDTVTIDGCKHMCAAKMVKESGGQVAHEVAVLDVFRRHKELKPEGIAELNEAGRKLARVLAEEVAGDLESIRAPGTGASHA